MLRIVVDSGSSIKLDEREKYQVDILPLRVQMGDDEFLDGVDLSVDEFYNRLINLKEFPKTSLPSLEHAQELVEGYTNQGDDVLIITISSGISGTFQTLKMLFADNEKVTVFDSQMAVGGVRFLVEEARKYENEPMEVIVEKLDALVPRIVTAAIPETLDYLLAGGRLSKLSWMLGTMLSIKPVIGFVESKVTVLVKKRGLKQAMKQIVDLALEDKCDPEYGIIASYTYNKDNVDQVIQMSPPEIQAMVKVYDNLIPSIACHWGPNAFGYIYVKGKTS
ncbi:MAG: DegV family protein [Lachnospiraceae bacterium]|nr:DegV family protein [Lachnospiraceae bacterium]